MPGDEAEISLETRVVAAPGRFSSRVAGELVILDPASGEYFGLDPVGARVWEILEAPVPVAEIRDALLREFQVEATRCEADLLELLRELARHGLVEVLPGKEAS